MTNGFYQMHRGWMDNPVFRGQEFSRAQAWCWLIENACWKDTPFDIQGETVTLHRGQFCKTSREMAAVWLWPETTVRRFLKRLKLDDMIEMGVYQTCLQTSAGNGAGRGAARLIVTICNYETYQAPQLESGAGSGAGSGAKVAQERRIKEEGKKVRKESVPDFSENQQARQVGASGKSYAFSGRIVKLNQEHYDLWKKTYHAIPDFDAYLQKQDDFYAGLSKQELGKWFPRLSAALGKAHQQYLAERQQRDDSVDEQPGVAERSTPWVDEQRRKRQREALER